MIQFLYEGKKYISVVVEGLPSTVIKCDESPSNEAILKICQDWVKALGFKDSDWHLDVRLH